MNGNDASTTSTLELLDRMKTEMPEIFGQAEVVGKWVWVQFNVPPLQEIRIKLKQLGFHWNGARKCWQHPCGESRARAAQDPRSRYASRPASFVASTEASPPMAHENSKEYKVVSLREFSLPETLHLCDTSDRAAEYWRLTVPACPYFNPECECFIVLFLNARRRVKGHQLVSIGTLDTILVHPREVFRAAIVSAASAVIIMHNHPSGESTPSEADIKVTRDLIRAGQLLKIDVLDHVIIGNPTHSSLRELGYFYS
jgi:hypothetical protein